MTHQARPEPGRHTSLKPGDRVRHWSEGYHGAVVAVVPMDDPMPDYCHVSTDDGKTIACPHNQLVRIADPKGELIDDESDPRHHVVSDRSV